ncbi:DNA topoisomerase III alpha [Galdieria sulphuraria]|uniref:DNA topoisomerase n=1 Tax=Galdieria sulphuraria TaxID=130081 RepID=M2Y2M1_GALSU|nr:DNA topoisomerase III alpha [Galdieria sulphuraria]EME30198.1 DNA topoisomerase III alpha [Galdieria sulphuraria]|eukprot:XP_005706718.1 DNA topoisomerase III alpha [Galdieria sulphuraria]
MRQVLIVTEKPSIAETVANALSQDSYRTRAARKSPCRVHEFRGYFRGQMANIKVTSVLGHVYSFDFTKEYNDWNLVEAEELFFAGVRKVVADSGSKVVRHLATEAIGVDYLVLWLDCDREGENIAFEVISCVKHSLQNVPVIYGNRANVFRAKFSALTTKDICRAMENLTYVDTNQASAVDVRAEIDLKVGVAFTRFQTRYFHDKFSSLDSKLVSYGPCQTPTLGFCVGRLDEISKFSPETFFLVVVNVRKNNRTTNWYSSRGKIFERKVASAIVERINSYSSGISGKIIDRTTSKERRHRPLPLNTVELLKLASKRLKMSPHQVAQVAESLYTQGLISYPRTESSKYPSSFDIEAVLSELEKTSTWFPIVKIFREGKYLNKSRQGGVDKGDHPPITPVRGAERGSLRNAEHERVYELIVYSFLASVSEDAVIMSQQYWMLLSGEKFVFSQRKLVVPGWLEFSNSSNHMESLNMNSEIFFEQNESIEDFTVSLEEMQTEPPEYLSESDLVGLMEKYGIGTDASIPTHINNIITRGYVRLSSERRLIPTQLGILLYRGYQKIDPQLVSPVVRSHIEQEIAQVASGQVDAMSVVEHCLSVFWKKFIYFRKHIDAMDDLFETVFTNMHSRGKKFSLCGRCNRYMKLIEEKQNRLFCMNCNDTLKLPPGKFHIMNGNKCSIDSFELVTWVSSWGRPLLICPKCFLDSSTDTNFKEPEWYPGLGCTQLSTCCSLSCPWRQWHQNTIGLCAQCVQQTEVNKSLFCPGVLFLSPRAPVQVYCNRCSFSLKFSQGSVVQVGLEEQDEKCSACHSKKLWFKSLSDNVRQKGCLYCDSLFLAVLTRDTPRRAFRVSHCKHRTK